MSKEYDNVFDLEEAVKMDDEVSEQFDRLLLSADSSITELQNEIERIANEIKEMKVSEINKTYIFYRFMSVLPIALMRPFLSTDGAVKVSKRTWEIWAGIQMDIKCENEKKIEFLLKD